MCLTRGPCAPGGATPCAYTRILRLRERAQPKDGKVSEAPRDCCEGWSALYVDTIRWAVASQVAGRGDRMGKSGEGTVRGQQKIISKSRRQKVNRRFADPTPGGSTRALVMPTASVARQLHDPTSTETTVLGQWPIGRTRSQTTPEESLRRPGTSTPSAGEKTGACEAKARDGIWIARGKVITGAKTDLLLRPFVSLPSPASRYLPCHRTAAASPCSSPS